MSHSKGSERINVYPVGVWVDASKFFQFTGVALLNLADGGDSVTAQLRKATDANGSNPANFGDAVTVSQPGSSPAADELIKAAANGRSDELGKTGGGVPYTHVSLSISGGSPEIEQGVLIGFDPRYSEDAIGV